MENLKAHLEIGGRDCCGKHGLSGPDRGRICGRAGAPGSTAYAAVHRQIRADGRGGCWGGAGAIRSIAKRASRHGTAAAVGHRQLCNVERAGEFEDGEVPGGGTGSKPLVLLQAC
jgi:hypothetical protein